LAFVVRLLYALCLFVGGGEISGILLEVSGVVEGDVKIDLGFEGEEPGLLGDDMTVSWARGGEALVSRAERGEGEFRSGEEERGDG
jgi:hypothetical protein